MTAQRTLRPSSDARVDLPAPLARLVSEAASGRSVSQAERDLVLEELTSHFLDGLDAGHSVDDLGAAFGDATLAATLIGRARKRCRPVSARVRAAAGRTLAGSLVLVLTPYTYSAARLRGEPALAYARVVDEGLRSTPHRAATARALLESARTAARAGDAGLAVHLLSSALDEADSLRAASALAPELESATITAAVVSTIDELTQPPFSVGATAAPLADRLRRVTLAGDMVVRMAVVGAGVHALIDRVYAPADADGRLTSRGLRVVQQFKGATSPPLRARVLEPAFFAFAASRDDATAEARRLLALAADVAASSPGAHSALLRELARNQASPYSSLRFYPVTLVMARAARALEAGRTSAAITPPVIARLDSLAVADRGGN